jgi:DNA mismatch repair protein MutS2
MDPRTLADLLLDRVLLAAADRCQTARGRDLVVELRPLARREDAEAELVLVEEAAGLIQLPDHPSLDGVEDVGPSIESASKGGVLAAGELIATARLLRRGHDALRVLAELRLRAPLLAAAFATVKDLVAVAERIESTFDEEGRVRDDASPRLGELRAKAAQLGRRVKERIESMLRDSQVQDLLQDTYYTLREGRYVLPVKAEDHRLVPGIIHGTSRTGATFFVEPVAIVEDNNQLKVVIDQVESEELAVLSDRSALVGRFARECRDLSSALWRLDSIMARARLARDLGASRPILGGAGDALSLVDARNPVLLLLRRKVVPVSPVLPPAPRGAALVLSGPNAGGKSVTLSTVGLCCVLVRHGILPPVSAGSVVPWYDRVLTVVGDPTNMDRAVSTFTGQLARLREILDRGPGRTLVLADELATGTEPRRGEALAVAIVRALVDGGAECLVTTHYDALKRLASEDGRFVNARVGLDPKTGLPDYRLETGATGESNPFEVAASVGFPAPVIEAAKALVDTRERRLDELLAETERLKAELATGKAEVDEARRRAQAERKRYEAELARLRSESDRLVYEARREVLQKMKRLEEELDQIARQARAEKEAARVVVRRAEVRERKAAVRQDMDREAALVDRDLPVEPLPATELVAGARVYVFPLRAEGKVVEVAGDGRRATVQVGLLKTAAKLSDLRRPKPASAGKAMPRKAPAGPEHEPPAPPPDDAPFVRSDRNTVDVRGMRVDEAIAAVDKMLDDAFLAHEPIVLVVHGMGTSALRKAIRDYLKTSRYVRSSRPGAPGEGGEGVTFVRL